MFCAGASMVGGPSVCLGKCLQIKHDRRNGPSPDSDILNERISEDVL